MNRRYKETLAIAMPVIFAHFIEVLVPFINTYLAAQISNNALAASAIVTSTFISLMGFCWGVVTAIGIITSQKIGGKNFKNIGLILKAGLFIAFIISLVDMVILYNFKPIWLYFGQDEEIATLAYLYLCGWLIGVVPDNFKYAIFQYCISFNRTRIPVIAHIITVPLIYFINDSLIWGKYGLPKLGIFGLGLGTALVYWLVSITMFLYVFMDKELGGYLKVSNKIKDYLETMKELLKLGLPIGIMFSIEITFFMIFSMMMGLISKDALAAYQINTQWIWTIVVIAYGFTESIIILAGRAFGANDMQLAKIYFINCLLTSGFIVSLASILYWLNPEFFISFDIDMTQSENKEIVEYAKVFFIYGGLFQIIDSIRIIISGTLRGINIAQYPMWVALISFWIIGIPLCYTLGFVLNFKSYGLWAGLLIIVITSTLLLYSKLRKQFSQFDNL